MAFVVLLIFSLSNALFKAYCRELTTRLPSVSARSIIIKFILNE
jgi:hypothetical protein